MGFFQPLNRTTLLAGLAGGTFNNALGSAGLTPVGGTVNLFSLSTLPTCVFKFVSSLQEAMDCGGILCIYQADGGKWYAEGYCGQALATAFPNLGIEPTIATVGFRVDPSYGNTNASDVVANANKTAKPLASTVEALGAAPGFLKFSEPPAVIYYIGWICYADTGVIYSQTILQYAIGDVGITARQGSTPLGFARQVNGQGQGTEPTEVSTGPIWAALGVTFTVGIPLADFKRNLYNAIGYYGAPSPVRQATDQYLASLTSDPIAYQGLVCTIDETGLYVGVGHAPTLIDNGASGAWWQPLDYTGYNNHGDYSGTGVYVAEDSLMTSAIQSANSISTPSIGPISNQLMWVPGHLTRVVEGGLIFPAHKFYYGPKTQSIGGGGTAAMEASWKNFFTGSPMQSPPTAIGSFNGADILGRAFPVSYDSGALSGVIVNPLVNAYLAPSNVASYATVQPQYTSPTGQTSSTPTTAGEAPTAAVTPSADVVPVPTWGALGLGVIGVYRNAIRTIESNAKQIALSSFGL